MATASLLLKGKHKSAAPSAFVSGEMRVTLLGVISPLKRPVRATMGLKFEPVGDGGGCCLVLCAVDGREMQGKGHRDPRRERERE